MNGSRLIDPDDPRWPEVERRDMLLRDLLKASGWKVTDEVVKAAREQLGIPRSTLFRLVARFRQTKRATSLLPQSAGTPVGAKRIDPRVEKLIAEQIERFWLRRVRPTLKALIERVHDACRVEALRLPDRRTIQRRVNELDLQKTAGRRGEREVLAKVTPSPGSYTADRPNEVWQIDHTVVDVIVVDEEHRRPIGRPVLTVAIDVCTRMVVGFYLSLDPPSASSVGLCLLHAVYDKGAWLGERGLILTGPSQACPGFYTAIMARSFTRVL
jgi:putative transposase